MIQVAAPERQEKVRKQLTIFVAILVGLNIVLAGFLFYEINKRRQNNQTLSALRGEIQTLQRETKELTLLLKGPRGVLSRLEDHLELQKKTAEDIEKLKKENGVLVLNNRDFIRMFEEIQSDLDELRKKGVVISYKADSGT